MKTVLIFFVGLFSLNLAHANYEKSPGFFGFTRGCVNAIEKGESSTPPCLTSMTGAFVLDIFLSPFQSVSFLMDAMDSAKSKDKSGSSSSSKKDVGPEIPEEKKLANKLSLFMVVADDARNYLLTQTSTPLLESAVVALRSLESNLNPDYSDLTGEAQKLLQIESNILQALNNANGE